MNFDPNLDDDFSKLFGAVIIARVSDSHISGTNAPAANRADSIPRAASRFEA
jgi:hypothetical protein